MTKPFPTSSIYASLGWTGGNPVPPTEDETAYIVDDYLALQWILDHGGEATWLHLGVRAWDDREGSSDVEIINLLHAEATLCPVLPTMRFLTQWTERVGPYAPGPSVIRIPGASKDEQAAFVAMIGDRIQLGLDVRQRLSKGRPPEAGAP